MYVARSGKLYFYKYSYDKDIIVGNDLKRATLFRTKNRNINQLKKNVTAILNIGTRSRRIVFQKKG